jgi:ketosteroid isomerase-like protein
MSQQNLALVRRGFATLNAGQPDFSVYHPALVYHPRSDEPDPSLHVGREAFERLAVGFLESCPKLVFDVEELIEADGLVIASTVMRGQGSASGIEVTDAYVFVYRFRDGLIAEGWEYTTKEEALDAIEAEK